MQEAQPVIQVLREWKRIPAVVVSTSNPTHVELLLVDKTPIQVPVTPASLYSLQEHVTVLENPTQPGERLVYGKLNLWYLPIAWTLTAFFAFLTLAILFFLPMGSLQTWTAQGWQSTQKTLPGTGWVVELRPGPSARESLWRAFSLAALAMVAFAALDRGGNLLLRIPMAWAGVAYLLLLLYGMSLRATKRIRANEFGVETHSRWETRWVAWEEIRSLEFVPKYSKWLFRNAAGRDLLALDREEISQDQLDLFLTYARQKIIS